MAVPVPPDIFGTLKHVSEIAYKTDPENLIICEKRAIDMLGIKLLDLGLESDTKQPNIICESFQKLYLANLDQLGQGKINGIEQGCAISKIEVKKREFIPLFGVLSKYTSLDTVSSTVKGEVLLGNVSKTSRCSHSLVF